MCWIPLNVVHWLYVWGTGACCKYVVLCFVCDRYAARDDLKLNDYWVPCWSCRCWSHSTCAEIAGIIDDDDSFCVPAVFELFTLCTICSTILHRRSLTETFGWGIRLCLVTKCFIGFQGQSHGRGSWWQSFCSWSKSMLASEFCNVTCMHCSLFMQRCNMTKWHQITCSSCPSHPIDCIRAAVCVMRLGGKITRTVQCCVVHSSVSSAYTSMLLRLVILCALF